MKVAHYVHWAGVGGAEDMALDTIKYSRDQVETMFVTDGRSEWSHISLNEAASLGAQMLRTDPSVDRPDVLADMFRTIYRQERVDLVHVYACGDVQPGYQAAIDLGLPVVETAACVAFSHGWEIYKRAQPVYLCQKHWLHGGGGKAEFKIIHGGVDLDFLGTGGISIQDHKRRAGLDPDKPVVGWFGRFDKFKCPLSFVDIAQSIKHSIPDCQFVMYGDGPDKGRAEFLAKEAKVDIQFRGFTRDKQMAFSSMDVFCFPTWQEAFGRVMPEAMACGVPIVTCDYPVCMEVCGGGALYVENVREDPMPIRNAQLYADAVVRLLRDRMLWLTTGAKGFAKANMEYDARRMANEYVQLYKEMVGRPA